MMEIYYVGLCVWLIIGSGAVLGLAILRRRAPAAFESAFLGGTLGFAVPAASMLWPLGVIGVLGLGVAWALGSVRPLKKWNEV